MLTFSTFKSKLFLTFIITNLLFINFAKSQNWVEHNIFSESDGLGTNPEMGSGDVDNDGDIDILIRDFNAICYFPNNGLGDFGSKITIATGWGLQWGNNLNFIDQEGDGDFDILTSNNSGEVKWLINDGTGNFSELLVGEMSLKMNDLDLQDIDGDNDLDIITSTFANASFGENLAWFENTGSGNYTKHGLAGGVGFRKFVNALDIDGDADKDILTFSSDSGILRWYENDGAGNFEASVVIEGDFDLNIVDLNVADFDGDGLSDILFSTRITGTGITGWRKNNGDGSFANPVTINSAGATGILSISHSFPADYNLDGHMDVLLTGTYRDELSIFLNDGLGNFELLDRVISFDDLAPYNLCTGDFNGDGSLNPACYYDTDPTSTNHDNISWFESDIVPTLTTDIIDITCRDNETPLEGTDDYFEVTLDVSSTFISQEFTVSVDNGSVSTNSIMSNSTPIIFEFESGSAGGGDKILTISHPVNTSILQNILIEDNGNCIVSSTEDNFQSSADNQVTICPNPTGNSVKILTQNRIVDEVKIFNIYGKNLATIKASELINLSTFESGTYILKIQLEDKQVIFKQVVKY